MPRKKKKKIKVSRGAVRSGRKTTGSRKTRARQIKVIIGMAAGFLLIILAMYIWPMITQEVMIRDSSSGDNYTIPQAMQKAIGGNSDVKNTGE